MISSRTAADLQQKDNLKKKNPKKNKGQSHLRNELPTRQKKGGVIMGLQPIEFKSDRREETSRMLKDVTGGWPG